MPQLAAGEMLPTMCLTEPGAGSDLGRIRCRGEQTGDGWRISGEKIFISGGDQDMSERILHLVLARTSDNGVKGLSLFLCPCRRSDGSRNAVTVTRIEEKMGLHASPTCQLAFDNAEAELVGEEGQGLAAMFAMMNHARTDVALQGVAHAARAYDIAASYAAERQQGRSPEGVPVTIDQHADVRRMIDEIDRLALGARAIAHLACVTMERGDNSALVEFLTPLAKVYCTEAGMRAAELGMQVLGGYGYLREYRIEQTYRDARITAIYEGTNGIHARMMATRLAGSAAGDAFASYMQKEASRLSSEKAVMLLELWHTTREGVLNAKDPSVLAEDFLQASIKALLACIWANLDHNKSHHPDGARLERLCSNRSA
jgi:alkylation response protein AidB-like acyl-CoA dehydrogenase